jgi:hypothetical protein
VLSRRAFVGRLAAGAAVACAASIGRAEAVSALGNSSNTASGSGNGGNPHGQLGPVLDGVQPGTQESTASSGPPPWELLHPLAPGSELAHGWRAAELSAVVDGSCVLTLQNDRGRTHRVHLCRNDGRPQGLVYTKRFDLIVMNGGQGDLPTEEGLAQAVADVAHVLAANEDGREQQALVALLLPHTQRVSLFAGAAKLR